MLRFLLLLVTFTLLEAAVSDRDRKRSLERKIDQIQDFRENLGWKEPETKNPLQSLKSEIQISFSGQKPKEKEKFLRIAEGEVEWQGRRMARDLDLLAVETMSEMEKKHHLWTEKDPIPREKVHRSMKMAQSELQLAREATNSQQTFQSLRHSKRSLTFAYLALSHMGFGVDSQTAASVWTEPFLRHSQKSSTLK